MSRWREHHEDFPVGQSLWLGFSRVLEQCFHMACVALDIALASPLFRMACPYQPCMLSILLVVRPPTPPSPFRPSGSFLPKMQTSQNEPQIKQLFFFFRGGGGWVSGQCHLFCGRFSHLVIVIFKACFFHLWTSGLSTPWETWVVEEPRNILLS